MRQTVFSLSAFIFLCVYSDVIHAQQNDKYVVYWHEVDSLNSIGLPLSAKEKVTFIEKQAASDNLPWQRLKAIRTLVELESQTGEEEDTSGRDLLIQFMASLGQANPLSATNEYRQNIVLKSIAASWLASWYEKYLDRHQYAIGQQTEVAVAVGMPVQAWTTGVFLDTIQYWYDQSLHRPDFLQIPTDSVELLLSYYSKAGSLFQPSLFDLLARKAVDFYNHKAHLFSHLSDQSTTNSPSLFFNSTAFVSGNKEGSGAAEFPAKAVEIYRNAVKNALLNQRKDALAYWDLARLQFAHAISSNSGKNELYAHALDTLLENAGESPYFSTIGFVKAAFMYQGNPSQQEMAKADSVCRLAISRYPLSPGAQQCRQLLHEKHLSEISLECQEVVVPASSFQIRIKTKEVGTLQLQLYRISPALFSEIRQGSQYGVMPDISQWSKPVLTQMIETENPAVSGSSYRIPTIKGLQPGRYAVVIQDASTPGMAPALAVFQVSAIGWTSFGKNEKQVIQFLHRQSGKPIGRVKALIYSNEYNVEARQFIPRLEQQAKANKMGKMALSLPPYKQYFMTAISGKDTLMLDDALAFSYPWNGQTSLSAEIMTDRAIYRPGQVVYYKGLVIQKDKDGIPSVAPSKKVKIEWVDANSQVISTFQAQSSEFGTFDGSVTIPEGRLTGIFTLVVTGDNLYASKMVQVEEYKRPTYAVEVLPFTSICKLDSPAEVSISAKTYTGNAVQGARVTYTITRNAGLPYAAPYGRGMPYSQQGVVINRGETETDANGQANISFTASRDAALDSASCPVFYFSVDMFVTDARGETRPVNAVVSAGYLPYFWQKEALSTTDMHDNDSLHLDAKNWDGSAVTASARLKIYKLVLPENVLQPYFWTRQNQYVPYRVIPPFFPEEGLLPILDTLHVAQLAYSTPYTSGSKISFPTHLGPGIYRIVIQDSLLHNQLPALTQYKVVTDFKEKKFPVAQHLYSRLNQNKAHPGEKVQLSLGVAKEVVWANVVVYQSSRILLDTVVKVRNLSRIGIPVTEQELGGFGVHISYLKHNRYETISHKIDVPWDHKALKMEIVGLRDKTLPGSRQTYSIKIKGLQKGEKAEILASMYDASLDYFTPNQWYIESYPDRKGWFERNGTGIGLARTYASVWPPFMDTTAYEDVRIPEMEGIQMEAWYPMYMQKMAQSPMEADGVANEAVDNRSQKGETNIPAEKPLQQKKPVSQPVRKNLRETVFFLPRLSTDSTGTATFSFTMNEALTAWKLMLFAHSKGYSTGYLEKSIQTSLPMMVKPHFPRFFRENDTLVISGRIENQSDAPVKGVARLHFFKPGTKEDITGDLIKGGTEKSFAVSPGKDIIVTWNVVVPAGKWNALTWRMTAGNGTFEDGEENTLPVISSRVLVTESMPLTVQPHGSKSAIFKPLQEKRTQTSQAVRYVLEFVGHPVWYAIQSLPYIHYYNDISSIGLADKLFINQMGKKIVTDNPRIETVFELWKKQGDALKSPLQKNMELKSVLLEETPWVSEAMDESTSRQEIALLMDQNQLNQDKIDLLKQLHERQVGNGGIAWLPSMNPDFFTTLYLLEKIGQLYHLGILTPDDPEWTALSENALRYVDREVAAKYNQLLASLKKYGGNLHDNHLDGQVIQWLYVRSFFQHVTLTPDAVVAGEYYTNQLKTYWMKQRLYDQALCGFVLFRAGNDTWRNLVQSLREKAMYNPELGTYWPSSTYHSWNDWPLERHSLITLLLTETGSTKDELSHLQKWLLRHKQTSGWQTPKATILAIYSLLLSSDTNQPSHLLASSEEPVMYVGDQKLEPSKGGSEAGTAYTKHSWLGDAILPSMAKVTIENPGNSTAWGSLYYQYLEEQTAIAADKGNAIQLEAKWYCKKSTEEGEKLVPLDEMSVLSKGDILVLRLQVSADRHMEYLHLKAPNPSCTESVEVFSGYRYQGKTSYYLSTRDASVQFYLPALDKGTYIFEHEVRIEHAGSFQSGLATIECLYAPEFRAHSGSINIHVRE